MTLTPASKPILLLALALGAASCRSDPAPTPRAPDAEPVDSPSVRLSVDEAAAVVFQIALGSTLSHCSDPTLHGLDGSGAKIWSKIFLDGEVRCSRAETDGLAQVRIEHPFLGLREALRFEGQPTGTVRIDPVLFGNCSIQLTGLTESDLQAHLVLRHLNRESYMEAVFNGRSEILDSLNDLQFERLPIGRYSVGLFRADPFSSASQPYREVAVSVQPCRESVLELGGE